MVLQYEQYETKLSLLFCLYLDAYAVDPQFAMKDSNIPGVPDSEDAEKLKSWHDDQIVKARKFLQGYCKGLVEDRDSPDLLRAPISQWEGSAGSKCILFVHRTIVEFLQRPDIRDTMSHQQSGFDPVEGISQLHLAEILPMSRYLIDSHVWATMYGTTFDMRYSNGKDRSTFDYLMRLESVIFVKYKHLLNGDLHQDKGTIYAMGRKRHTIWGTRSPRFEGSACNILQAHPLCMSAWLGNIAYVHWRTSEPTKLPDWMNVKAVILHCLQHHLRMFYQPEHFAKARSCFEMSLEDVDSHGTRYLWPGLLYQCATIEHPYNSPMWLRTTGKLIPRLNYYVMIIDGVPTAQGPRRRHRITWYRSNTNHSSMPTSTLPSFCNSREAVLYTNMCASTKSLTIICVSMRAPPVCRCAILCRRNFQASFVTWCTNSI
jgi:hypothetical protein